MAVLPHTPTPLLSHRLPRRLTFPLEIKVSFARRLPSLISTVLAKPVKKGANSCSGKLLFAIVWVRLATNSF
jgi:hypothetical protein